MLHLDTGAIFLQAKLQTPFPLDNRNNISLTRKQKLYVDVLVLQSRKQSEYF